MASTNPVIEGLSEKGWLPVGSREHPLGKLRTKRLRSYFLLPLIGTKNRFGATYFQLFLVDKEGNISRQPVIIGLHSRGIYPAYNWIEIIKLTPQVDFPSGEKTLFSFTAGSLTRPLFKHLVNLLPPGGHIMVEYDSPERQVSARLLAAGVPPAATPIGYTLFTAGCDAGFRDWYIAEGGTEGPRKLQGFKSLNSRHAEEKVGEMASGLKSFLNRPSLAVGSSPEREARKRASTILRSLSSG